MATIAIAGNLRPAMGNAAMNDDEQEVAEESGPAHNPDILIDIGLWQKWREMALQDEENRRKQPKKKKNEQPRSQKKNMEENDNRST